MCGSDAMGDKTVRTILLTLSAAVLLGHVHDAWAQSKSDDRVREMQRRFQSALKKSEEEKAALARETEELKQKLVGAGAKAAELAQVRAALAAQSRQSQSLSTELQSVRSSEQAAAKRSAQLQADLDAQRRQTAALQEKLDATETLLGERVEQARKLMARAAAQEKRVTACVSSNAKLREVGLSCIARVQTHVVPGMDSVLQFERVRLENALEAIRGDLDAASLPESR